MKIAFGLLAVAGLAAAANAALVFDNATAFRTGVAGAVGTSTSSTPNTFMGDGYVLAAGTTQIAGFDIYPVNLSGTNFTGLKITIYVWDNVNTGTVSASTPAFSGLLATYTLTTTGAFTTGFYYPFEGSGGTPGITLGVPLALADTTIGLTFNYQGTTDGVNYTSANSLTSIISAGGPATVGSNMFNGYYRNANSETNGNFTSTLRSVGLTNQSVAVRIYDSVPTPGSLALLGLGGLAAARRRR